MQIVWGKVCLNGSAAIYLARRLNGRKPAPLAALPEREYPGDAAVLAERLANMDNIARQEDTWGAQEDVEVHGWSDADSDV